MAQLTVKINGYAYTIGCADGQEQHLQAMASEVESRVDKIKALGSQSGESRLLVQAALLMGEQPPPPGAGGGRAAPPPPLHRRRLCAQRTLVIARQSRRGDCSDAR